jgi:hypothetical protein
MRPVTALLPDQEQVQCSGHPHTLTTRNNLAYWMTQVRDSSRDEPGQGLLAELGGLVDDALAAPQLRSPTASRWWPPRKKRSGPRISD